MKIYRFITALVWFCCACAALAHESSHLTIVTEEFSPYNYAQDGEIRGLSVDVVKEMARRVGSVEYDIQLYPWLRAIQLSEG